MPNSANIVNTEHTRDSINGQFPAPCLMTASTAGLSTVRALSYLTNKVKYPDHVFINAAKIYQNSHRRKPPDRIVVKYGSSLEHSSMDFHDEKSQRWSYELAFSALKYQDLLENIMVDSGFYHSLPLPDELTSLVVVMLYDFQDRKFLPRYAYPDEEINEEVREVEKLLYSYKTKLAASLARNRIKYAAASIEYILPDNVRKQEERASLLPLYAWINTVRTSLTDVFNTLKRRGFIEVKSPSEFDGYNYCMDNQCQNVILFPPHLKEELINMELCIDYNLVLQDKSHSLAVQTVRALLITDSDIIVANPCPGLTLTHLSILTNESICTIFACGMKSEIKKKELEILFSKMDCKNIKLLQEAFTEIDPADKMLQKAKVILLQPQCSGSGINDPVSFILNEQGDTTLLQNFSEGSMPTNKLHDLANQQLLELNHAMKFGKVQGIVYSTSSIYEEENDHVVNKALELSKGNIKGQPYRLGLPVVPLQSSSDILPVAETFVRIEPSETTNGCFLAILSRERDPAEIVTAKDVLARAASKGILDGIGSPSKRGEKKRKGKGNVSKAATKPGSATQPSIAEFLNRETESFTYNALSKQDPAIVLNPMAGIHFKKPSKPVPAAMRNTSSFNVPRTSLRQTTAVKLRAEDKMTVLRPMQILLPPVSMPAYSQPTVAKLRSPIHCYQRWYPGSRSNSQKTPTPTMSIVGKSKETVPMNVLKHPNPWH
uniref:NOP2/Sun RNA methyltransferase family member 7 n=1 Tax=Leptobrachium leishanense TaxID=445787 RepID=A0A8C5PV10_9ANUR